MKISAGMTIANIVPTDFSYRYLIADFPSVSIRLALCGNTIVATAFVGISTKFTTFTAMLNEPEAAGEIIPANIHWSIVPDRMELSEVAKAYLP